MDLHRELVDRLPFDPAERDGLWGLRGAPDPTITRFAAAAGAAVALLLATGGGVAPRADWGAAVFFGLAIFVGLRGLLLARLSLSGPGRAARPREVNEAAVARIAAGAGVALALFLATGGGGIGPAFDPVEAFLASLFAALLVRGLLTLCRWP